MSTPRGWCGVFFDLNLHLAEMQLAGRKPVSIRIIYEARPRLWAKVMFYGSIEAIDKRYKSLFYTLGLPDPLREKIRYNFKRIWRFSDI